MGQVYLFQAQELVHHQLRIFSWIRFFDAIVQKYSIAAKLEDFHKEIKLDDAVIVNFNYDSIFLRELFPGNKIITIINDDFIAQARFVRGKVAVKSCLSKVLGFSDRVFTVSNQLNKMLSKWCHPMLFLPWADVDYQPPSLSRKRDTILVWCFFNRNFDYSLIARVAKRYPQFRIRLVGPMAHGLKVELADFFSDLENVLIEPSAALNELELDECFVSIIPYLEDIEYVKAINASNKTFQLTARGIPIITKGIPNFIESLGIFLARTDDAFLERISYCFENFYELQPGLREISLSNNRRSRYQLFMDSLQDI